MKKGILLAALITILLTSCRQDWKYRIKDQNGTVYHTNSLEKDGDCVEFKDVCGCSGQDNQDGSTIRVCGSYTIRENPDYKSKRRD